MKNDPHRPTDPTENWLRQALGGHSPEAPADAWQRLAPHLPQRKRRRPLVFWMSGAAVGVAAVVVLFWFLKNAVPPVSIEKTPPAAPVVPAFLPENLAKKEATISAEKIAAATAEANFSEKFNLKTSPIFNKNLVGRDANNGQPTTGEPDFSEKTTSAASVFLEKLPGKPLAPLVLPEKLLPNSQFLAAPILPKKAKAPRFWLGIEAAPALFMQKNMGGMPVGLAFPETHPHSGHGWQAGISLAFEPRKNWRVALGIQHLRQAHEAAHSATLRLMDGVCLNPDDPGLKEYEFRYAVVSGGERSDLTLRLQQQDIGSAMPDDEPFTLDMKTLRRTAAWRVPLTVERRLGIGKWRGFVRGGGVADFSEKTKIEVAHFTEACQDLCFQSGHHPAIEASGPSRVLLGWLAGAGLERQISGRTALRLEPFVVGQKGSMQCGLNFGLLFSN